MRNIPYWLNIGSILYQYGCVSMDPSGNLALELELENVAVARCIAI